MIFSTVYSMMFSDVDEFVADGHLKLQKRVVKAGRVLRQYVTSTAALGRSRGRKARAFLVCIVYRTESHGIYGL
ncbi:hypothetical protein QN277_028300 [Acacia crassicarpa]|uniref:Uncharacterized protein n=1 Tax=Acacia crassicarpa TaxID=499986 RepID=A0AAE1K3A2_9FABA|nr:hypothetical protein QN277_028300 [Acacia crassicarpa]